MDNPQNNDAHDFHYRAIESAHLASGAERSTMMGLPCLRHGGKFFASMERGSGDLIVKLPETRVDELIDAGVGLAFAPNGRRFREWVRVEKRDQILWSELTDEARDFADR